MATDHYSEIQKVEGPFRAEYEGTVLAESDHAMELQEYHPSYEFAPVYYLPLSSVHLEKLEANEHHTSCPIKGQASYWDLKEGSEVKNIAWTYPMPLDQARDLQDTVAFDLMKQVKLYRNGEEITRKGIKKK